MRALAAWTTAGRRQPQRQLRNPFAVCMLAAPVLLAWWIAPRQAFGETPHGVPNIVVVLADDLGYGDLGCYGHSILKTPHLDRLARQGVRFTDCYAAAANCSPARAGLMTGRTPYRCGIHSWIPMHSPMHLKRSEVTIAALLRESGYATCHVGKWHLCGKFNSNEQPQPPDHGFDYWFSTQNNALPNHRHPDNFVRNGKPAGKLNGYSADLVADEAIRWLNEVREPRKPFFLFVCLHEPHEPIATADKYQELYAKLDQASQRRHHGNITQMDAACGKLLAELDRLELSESTFLFFTSDNGPAMTSRHPHGSAGPLRAKKGHVYEGGIRVPGILRWPGHTKAGTVCDEPVSGVDVLPTLCEIAGIAPPRGRPLDGASFLPVLEDKPIHRTKPLYWQFNFARSNPKVALRDGDWKVLATLTGPELKPTGHILPGTMNTLKRAELDRFELYNLAADIAETNDLAEEEPQRLAEMSAKLKRMYREVREESPTWPAWEWPRYEAKRIEWAGEKNR